MSGVDKLFYCRAALMLKFIGLKQYNRVVEVWEQDKTRDTSDILRELDLLSPSQWKEIEDMAAKGLPKGSISEDTINLDDDSDGEVVSSDPNHYDVMELIGQGGVGRVSLAHDKNLDRDVALKELMVDEEDPSYCASLARFIKEARLTGLLEHPGVVPVYDIGINPDGTVFYAMKYIKGRTIHDVLKACNRSSPEESLKMRMKLLDSLISACEATGYAHSKGIVHRDLKPGNIVVGAFGETVILDWGLAKKKAEDDHVRSGSMIGTVSYMPPEQADPTFGDIDERSDVYSLGTLLYMILTGQKVYIGERKDVLKRLVGPDPTPSPDSVSDAMPPELVAICNKALSKDKGGRFRNAGEMAEELKAYRDGRLVSVYAYTRGELIRRFISRNKGLIAAVAAVVLSIAVGGGLAVDFGIKAHKARKMAENALVDITSLSQKGAELSSRIVMELEGYFDGLKREMAMVAGKLARVDIKDVAVTASFLDNLYKQHKEVRNFEIIVAPGIISAVVPDEFNDAVGSDVSRQDHVEWIFQNGKPVFSKVFKTEQGFEAVVFQVPIINVGKTVGVVSALMETGKLIPSILSIDPVKSPFNVWCMQEDGSILYDEDSRHIGQILFQDDIQSKYPELVQFGKGMLKDRWGVGYYQYTEKPLGRNVHKVAVWDTFTPSEEIYSYGSDQPSGVAGFWKIVVSHPYRMK